MPADSLAVSLLAQIRLVMDLREGSDVGVPVTVADPQSEASQAFDALARRVVSMGPGRISRPELRIS